MSAGWRQNFADVIAAIRGTLADAFDAGSMSAADFLKLAGLPPTAPPTSRLINTTAPLTGGGNLSADRTLAISAASGGGAGSMSAADFSKLAGLPSTAPPTSRLIGTTAPLTGGGDLSADRTLAISAASGGGAGSMSAADFSKLASVASGRTLVGLFKSPLIDFQSLGATNIGGLDVAGFTAVIVSAKVEVVTATATVGATASVGNATAAVGPFDNYIALQAFPPSFTAPGTPPQLYNISIRANWQLLDLGANPIKVNVTVAANNTCTGYVVLAVALFPI